MTPTRSSVLSVRPPLPVYAQSTRHTYDDDDVMMVMSYCCIASYLVARRRGVICTFDSGGRHGSFL